MQPGESSAAKAARIKEQERAQKERNEATQDLAAGVTSDVQRTYDRPFSLFNLLRKRK